MPDLALIKAGVVTTVARNACAPESFGPEPDGEIVAFPNGEPVPGMLYNAETGALTNPLAEE